MNHGVTIRTLLLVGCISLPAMATTCLAEENTVNDKISNALKRNWGQIKANIRYRYEHVE